MDEMYQIIDNMAFLSKLLQALQSGLPLQLNNEQKKFLQHMVSGKATQVFDALDQIDVGIDIDGDGVEEALSSSQPEEQ